MSGKQGIEINKVKSAGGVKVEIHPVVGVDIVVIESKRPIILALDIPCDSCHKPMKNGGVIQGTDTMHIDCWQDAQKVNA